MHISLTPLAEELEFQREFQEQKKTVKELGAESSAVQDLTLKLEKSIEQENVMLEKLSLDNEEKGKINERLSIEKSEKSIIET